MAEETITQQRQYLSYLLRLWKASGGSSDRHGGTPPDPPLWRASLESPKTCACLGFASLEALFAFLGEETGLILRGIQDQAEEGSDEYSGPQVMGDEMAVTSCTIRRER